MYCKKQKKKQIVSHTFVIWNNFPLLNTIFKTKLLTTKIDHFAFKFKHVSLQWWFLFHFNHFFFKSTFHKRIHNCVRNEYCVANGKRSSYEKNCWISGLIFFLFSWAMAISSIFIYAFASLVFRSLLPFILFTEFYYSSSYQIIRFKLIYFFLFFFFFFFHFFGFLMISHFDSSTQKFWNVNYYVFGEQKKTQKYVIIYSYKPIPKFEHDTNPKLKK